MQSSITRYPSSVGVGVMSLLDNCLLSYFTCNRKSTMNVCHIWVRIMLSAPTTCSSELREVRLSNVICYIASNVKTTVIIRGTYLNTKDIILWCHT